MKYLAFKSLKYYNPNSENVGTFFKFEQNETKRISNRMSQYFIHNRT